LPALVRVCSECHAADTKKSAQFLLSPAHVRERRYDIQNLLASKQMPPAEAAQTLTVSEATSFASWVKCGAPDN